MTPRKNIYMDHNAATPMHPEVLNVMELFFKTGYGNPSSLHAKGREARAAVEEARAVIGDFLGTESVDIIFTSGGTESNNMAIKGACLMDRSKAKHIITSSIEHLSVLEACRFIEGQGLSITYLPVDKYGMVNPKDVEEAIRDETALVSIMHSNNEVGTIQPVKGVSKLLKDINSARLASHKPRIYFHTDAVQSCGKAPLDVEELGIDLLSLSAHKIYGPKGIGALYIRKGTEIVSLFHGGHHERGMRAGTENVPSIAGFAKAIKLCRKNFKEAKRIKALRDRLYLGLKDKIKDITLYGHPEKRLFNTLNMSFAGIEGDSLLLNLDLKGIYASAGSACASGSLRQSHVLKAMGVEDSVARGVVRFSLGLGNTGPDIDYCLKEIPAIVKRLRSVSTPTPS